MLNRLNNTNGKGSNAVVNKQIKELQEDISCLRTDVNQNTIDIADIDSALDDKVSKSELATEVDTASVKANAIKVDTIESKDNASIQVNDNVTIAGDISAREASFTKVNVDGVDIVDDLNSKVSCARTDASNAVQTANDALSCACSVQSDLDDYKAAQLLETNTVQANIGCARVSCSIETPALTVTSCGEIRELTSQTIKAKAELMDAFVEPTAKGNTDFYLFYLPPKFQGRVHLVAYDTNDDVSFSATIDTSFSDRAGSALGDREGTGILIHSGVTKWDFYQLLRRKDQDRLAFITQSNVKKLYYKYDNFDKTEEPTYEIYPNLTDEGPDYTLYDTIYTAEHSDQVVIYGNEDTLNGGLTVFGTFYATAFEVPETEVSNVRVKENIYGGYDCDTGEFSTKGTRGGLITYSDCPGLPRETITWVNGCPRTVVRKGVCECADGYGHECSQLCYEPVIHCTTEFKPSVTTDYLFDETSLANYKGETSNATNPYPIKHLNEDTCVHGDIEVECDVNVCGKVVTNCIESKMGCDLGITSKKDFRLQSVCSVSITTKNVTSTITENEYKLVRGTSNEHIVGNRTNCYEGTEVSVHDKSVDRRYACGKSETLSAGDYTLCAQGGNVAITACCDVGFTSDTHNIYANETTITCQTNIDKLRVNCVNDNLNVDGDIRTKGQVITDGDIVTHGNLYVDGAITATEETQIATKGDYLVTRESNGAAMASTDYSGVAVNNYDGNGSIATITADHNGEWRVSDTADGTTTTFTNISNFANTWYDALTRTTITGPDGVLSNISLLELSNVVYNAAAGTETVVGYYHKSGSDWFGPITVVNGEFDLGSLVLNDTDIATLNALTTSNLVYYNTVTSTIIDASQNQPLLTREEKTDLRNNDILSWDATNAKATNVCRPTLNNTVLTAQIDNLTGAVSYAWKSGGSGAICCYPSRACANAAILIQEGCDGYVPDNAQIIIEDEVNYVLGENRGN